MKKVIKIQRKTPAVSETLTGAARHGWRPVSKATGACRLAVIMLAVALLGGCKGVEMKQDIIKYAEYPENGLRKTVDAGNCIFTIQYKPAAYIIKMEHPESKTAWAEREKQLDSMVWFNVSFRVKDYSQSPLRYQVSGLADYNARLDYYLNRAQGDFYLLCGSDSLYPSAYWFQNSQNLGDKETMVVGFRLKNSPKPEHDLHLAYYDRVFQNGIIKTIIREKDIDNIPEVPFSNSTK